MARSCAGAPGRSRSVLFGHLGARVSQHERATASRADGAPCLAADSGSPHCVVVGHGGVLCTDASALWRSALPRGWPVAVFSLLLVSAAGYLNIRAANESWVTAWAVAWGWILWRRQQVRRGACLLGAIASMKLFLLILLPYFAWRRQWSSAAFFMAGVVAASTLGSGRGRATRVFLMVFGAEGPDLARARAQHVSLGRRDQSLTAIARVSAARRTSERSVTGMASSSRIGLVVRRDGDCGQKGTVIATLLRS